jgi:hypothetical protein
MLFAFKISRFAAALTFPMKNVPPPGRVKIGDTSW